VLDADGNECKLDIVRQERVHSSEVPSRKRRELSSDLISPISCVLQSRGVDAFGGDVGTLRSEVEYIARSERFATPLVDRTSNNRNGAKGSILAHGEPTSADAIPCSGG
jgi:hypothetical protein